MSEAEALCPFTTTTIATAVASFTWAMAEYVFRGKPSVLGFCSGAVAGLVVITPACGFVTVTGAVIIGLVAGLIPYLACWKLKSAAGYDDALDAFGVHGVGGTIGALLTGVFATREINDLRMGKPMGLVDGNAGQVLNNAIGAAIAWVIGIAGTWIILRICDAVTGIRTDEQQEIEGLDLSMHGEEGYNFEA
jgi:Amt family ammonium transporter